MARPKRKPAPEPETNGQPRQKQSKANEVENDLPANAVDRRTTRKRKIAAVAPMPREQSTKNTTAEQRNAFTGKDQEQKQKDDHLQAKKPRETLKKRHSKDRRALKKDRTKKIVGKEHKEPEHCLTVPKVPSLTKGEVLSVGSGDVGQLGLGADVMEKSRPFPVTGVPESVVDITAGGMHSVCLTESGKVYTFGCVDEGTLGRLTEEDEEGFVPGLVDLPERVVKISAGDSHSAALTETGSVYIWGNFRDKSGPMGLTCRGEKEPLPIRILPNVQCASLASGVEHLVCLGLDGQLYTLGNGENGQLGRISQYSMDRGGRRGLDHVLTPDAVHFRRSKNTERHRPEFDEVWAGGYCTFARERMTGTIYGFGLNNYDQLGEGQLTIFMPTPLKILAGKQWKMVASGDHHVLALDSTGQIYSWGRRDYGRLGLGDVSSDQSTPVLVSTLKEMKCTHIACGSTTSYAVSEEGVLYSWGAGQSNQLGHGNEDDCLVPTVVESKAMKCRTVVKVEGGGQHTLIMAIKKEESS